MQGLSTQCETTSGHQGNKSTQKQPIAVKKGAALFKIASVKKVVKSKGWL